MRAEQTFEQAVAVLVEELDKAAKHAVINTVSLVHFRDPDTRGRILNQALLQHGARMTALGNDDFDSLKEYGGTL